nr:gustatory receptor 2 [Holotrichia oblita]
MDEEVSYYTDELILKGVINEFKHSARAREICKRSQLSSSDGNILDQHDQFYRDHKLLLKLFQVLGVMPIQRGQIGRITFSWLSIPSIYAYCLYAITTVVVLLVGYERLIILTQRSKKFDEYIYSVIFVVFLVPHFWIPYVGWGVAKEVCTYKNSWVLFQLDYYKITGKSLKFPHLSTLIVIISSGCLILAIAFLLTLSALLEGFTLYHTTAYVHIITMINMNCALWYINCRAMGNASQSVADSFEEDVKQFCGSYIVKHYRILWLSLSEMLQTLGNAYARTYSTYSLFMITNITIAIYGFTSEIVDHGFRFTFKEMGLLVDAGYCLVLLYVFCDCSHNASRNIADRVQTTLLNIELSTVDSHTAKEIELFLIAIEMNPPKVSLQGYTVVNRELVTSSISTMAIYLIVLLQFKISLVKESKMV